MEGEGSYFCCRFPYRKLMALRGEKYSFRESPLPSKSEMRRPKSQDAKIGQAPRRNQDTPRSRTLRQERVHIVQVPREGYQRTTPTSSCERAVTGRERAKQGHFDPRIPAGVFCRRHLPESEHERAFLLRCKHQDSTRVLPWARIGHRPVGGDSGGSGQLAVRKNGG